MYIVICGVVFSQVGNCIWVSVLTQIQFPF